MDFILWLGLGLPAIASPSMGCAWPRACWWMAQQRMLELARPRAEPSSLTICQFSTCPWAVCVSKVSRNLKKQFKASPCYFKNPVESTAPPSTALLACSWSICTLCPAKLSQVLYFWFNCFSVHLSSMSTSVSSLSFPSVIVVLLSLCGEN